MKLRDSITRHPLTATAVVLALLGTAFLLWKVRMPGAVKVTAGKFPEELVYVQSKDDIVNGGAIFTPPKDSAKPIAVIWIHGWGVNFYSSDVRDDWPGARGARLYMHHRQYAHA